MANIHFSPRSKDFFFPLDNGAIFMASTTKKASPYLYRVSADLDETVFLPDLEKALDLVVERFPFFKTEIRPGVFWYYLDPLKKSLHLSADSLFPVEFHQLKRWGRYLFRVRVYGTRISCEFHHILTDGTGATEFLKSLIATYLTFRGDECLDWAGVKNPSDGVDPAEFEDAYANIDIQDIPLPDAMPAAFHLPGKRYPDFAYRVTTGTMMLPSALQIARDKNVSLTELLASVYLSALQSIMESKTSRAYQPICIQIPVNMRKFYPSATMRNFFLFITVSIDRRLGHFEDAEILEIVHHQFKLHLVKKELDRQIRRNVRGERYLWSKIIPLFIKNIVLRLIGKFAANKPFSGCISNLQGVSMPEPFASKVKRFDFLPSRDSTSGANIGVVSWKESLSVTIGSLVVDRSLEREFFTRCSEMGIPVTIESNI